MSYDYGNYRLKFYKECEALQKQWVPSQEYTEDNINAMKIPYNPSLKAIIAANFDHIVETHLQINLEQANQAFKLLGNSALVSMAKTIIIKNKKQVIERLKKEHPDWLESKKFEEWIDAKIEAITVPERESPNLSTILSQFWRNCANEWVKECDMEKFTPEEELSGRMTSVAENKNVKYVDCFNFAMCYIKTEGIFEKDNSIKLKCSPYFRLVTEPKEGDLIIYLNSDNSSAHTGVFLDSTHVISKFGICSIMKHNFQNCHYGDTYVILRKREDLIFWV